MAIPKSNPLLEEFTIEALADEIASRCPVAVVLAAIPQTKGGLAHDIDTEGRVTPSIVCPGTPPGIGVHDAGDEHVVLARTPGTAPCGFHRYVQLLNWPTNMRVDHQSPTRMFGERGGQA